ncbi:hypothetical protein BDY19DRAFT_295847 [Irpex rosettiformis]|uniref:Uncharacterized protein n=1 Tax=Irpex rosettiformis TaxID=378272 RepID=A0ACB8UHX4_9APHY|nr:hypothetical protein BDY19DRAFT_295847 [Irpex rosettiformis]
MGRAGAISAARIAAMINNIYCQISRITNDVAHASHLIYLPHLTQISRPISHPVTVTYGQTSHPERLWRAMAHRKWTLVDVGLPRGSQGPKVHRAPRFKEKPFYVSSITQSPLPFPPSLSSPPPSRLPSLQLCAATSTLPPPAIDSCQSSDVPSIQFRQGLSHTNK